MKTSRRKKINFLKIQRMVGITLVLVLAMTLAVKSSADGSPQNTYKEITVSRGDTLWDIARTYAPGENPEKTVWEIKKLNQMEKSNLYPGKKIKIPLNF